MSDKEVSITVDSASIVPMIDKNQTQLIFQRHCNYDRKNGRLYPESVEDQKSIMQSFITDLKNSFSTEDLQNTYFLFTSSNTVSDNDFKRCIETTNIAMESIKQFLKERHISTSHVINLNEDSNYNGQIHESRQLVEPKMFTDGTGYYDFLSKKYPNSRLVIWNGTHYDLISPLVKQRILHLEKSFWLKVDYCGGISLVIDELNGVIANVNGARYPFDFGEIKQPHRHF